MIRKNLEREVLDILLDAKRTASESAPHKSGNLEKGFDYSLEMKGDKIVGVVEVIALNKKGKDYAAHMHDANYKLGEGSRRKPGGKSAYGGGRVKVGKGYLSNTIEGASEGYTKALEDALVDATNQFK